MIATTASVLRPAAPASWIERVVPPDRVPSPWESVAHHLTWSLIHLGVNLRYDLTIRGTERIPTSGPAVIVANHGSHLDTLVIGSAVPRSMRSRIAPLAAGDTFFRNLPQGWLSSRFMNLRPLWRRQHGPHGLLRLRQSLETQDACHIVFPEGTRSRTGAMGHFKAGIGMMVAGSALPVIPCHIRGTFEAWPSHRRLPAKGALHLEIGEPLTFPDHAQTNTDWREIAQTLEDEVRRLGCQERR